MVTMTRREALLLLKAVSLSHPERGELTLDDDWTRTEAYHLLIERMKQDPDAPSVD